MVDAKLERKMYDLERSILSFALGVHGKTLLFCFYVKFH